MTNEDVIQFEKFIFMAMKRLHIHWNTEEEHQEYIDCGYDGILKGLSKYDASLGFQKSTFVYKCIETEIKRKIYLNQMKKRITKVVSLNTEIEEGELIDLIPDDIDIEEQVTKKLMIEKVKELVNLLPKEKDRQVITLLYGLDGNKPLTIRATAKVMGVNRNAIASRKNKILKTLQEKIKKEGL